MIEVSILVFSFYSFNNDFFVFLRNEGIFVATLDVKGGGAGVSDSNVILTLSVVRGNLNMDVTPYKISQTLYAYLKFA